jgi:hypothetical protein
MGEANHKLLVQADPTVAPEFLVALTLVHNATAQQQSCIKFGIHLLSNLQRGVIWPLVEDSMLACQDQHLCCSSALQSPMLLQALQGKQPDDQSLGVNTFKFSTATCTATCTPFACKPGSW